MERNSDLTAGLRAIKRVADNSSWFREHPHYWSLASLPFAYAMACVEVVSKSSEKTGEIYPQIVDVWGKPGVNTPAVILQQLLPMVCPQKGYHLLN